jgi:hypothetical protein
MRTTCLTKFAFRVIALSTSLLLFTVLGFAQGHGFGNSIPIGNVPPSVTSIGFGGHPGFRGVPPSVTSLGFGGHPGIHGVPPSVTSLGFGQPTHIHNGNEEFGHRHRRDGNGFFTPFFGGAYYGGGYYAPYDYSGYLPDDGVDDSMEQDYRGGPTIFDRRGPDSSAYDEQRSRDRDYRAELDANQPAVPQAPPAPVANQPTTLLIFKDGHKQEVSNYAIVGSTLYDLSDGRTRKVQLAELDLLATVKENDQRGVEFELPAGTKLN